MDFIVYCNIHTYQYTIVWEKFIVENIHVKIICCKKILSSLASNENFLQWNFFHWILSSSSLGSSWLLFHQFQLDKKLLHIKMEVCKRNSCVCITIAMRDAITGEERLESLNVKCKIMKVIDCCEERRKNCWQFSTKNILSL